MFDGVQLEYILKKIYKNNNNIVLAYMCQCFLKGRAENLKVFFLAFQYFKGGGAAQKIAEKIIFPT